MPTIKRTKRLSNKYRGLEKWIHSGEESGEFLSIRFGCAIENSNTAKWLYYSHADYDGIGAFADILDWEDETSEPLPTIKPSPSYPILSAIFRLMLQYMVPSRSTKWISLKKQADNTVPQAEPPKAVAWHAFDATELVRMRQITRKMEITINTLLLWTLNQAVKTIRQSPNAQVFWMVPVNMRSGVDQDHPLDSHFSYLTVAMQAADKPFKTHHQILHKLAKGEHWANWHITKSAFFLTAWMRKWLVKHGCVSPKHNIGVFSNIGQWNSSEHIHSADDRSIWLFCPPVWRTQKLGAGCVTFQNRLSLTIQAHPTLTTSWSTMENVLDCWVSEIHKVIREEEGRL